MLKAQRLLHIVHARQDEAWVRGVVIPALGLTEEQYWTRAEDDLGAPRLEELEHAVQSCRYTLLVASKAARVDEWTKLGSVLAQHLGIEEGKPRLLVVTRDFDPTSNEARDLLPLRQRCLVCLDCSDPERHVAALAPLAAQLALTTIEGLPLGCPYPGLRMFGTDSDSEGCFSRIDLFFGRDDEGEQIVNQLRSDRRVLLVGPSGCGKSSLARARVLPTFRTGTDAKTIAVIRPGAQPDVCLRMALDSFDPQLGPAIDAYLLADNKAAALPVLVAAVSAVERLIYIDQLEEVFLDDSPDGHRRRAKFFARLAALGRLPGMAILLGMRADFYGDLMRSPAWDDFKNHRVELAPLRGAALRRAITRPAEVCGVHVEVDLVERLVREAEADRAAEALPLLQVVLEQLWDVRSWRYLSLDSYARLTSDRPGTVCQGLDVVLARHADASIAQLTTPLQELARRLLIDLVHLGEGRPDTRRRRSERDLDRVGDETGAVTRVLGHLVARRLITSGAANSLARAGELVAPPSGAAHIERYVDLAHDALITGWPALTQWICDRREHLRTQRRLEARASGGGLLAASELPEFTRWIAWTAAPAGREFGASNAIQVLVRRSLAARRRRMTGLIVIAIVILLAGGIAIWQWSAASAAREYSDQMAGISILANDLPAGHLDSKSWPEFSKWSLRRTCTLLERKWDAGKPGPEELERLHSLQGSMRSAANEVFPQSRESCRLLFVSYAIYANYPNRSEWARLYADLYQRSGGSCGTPEYLDEIWAQEALDEQRYDDAEAYAVRVQSALDAEVAVEGNDDERINSLTGCVVNQLLRTRAALGAKAPDRARARLDDAKRSLEALRRSGVTFRQLEPVLAQLNDQTRELERSITEAARR